MGEVFNRYTDSAGNEHWCDTETGHHMIPQNKYEYYYDHTGSMKLMPCDVHSVVRENVRGEWIEDKKAEQEHQLIFHKVWTCSQCGERQCRPKGSNFCPNCGADMRGES